MRFLVQSNNFQCRESRLKFLMPKDGGTNDLKSWRKCFFTQFALWENHPTNSINMNLQLNQIAYEHDHSFIIVKCNTEKEKHWLQKQEN